MTREEILAMKPGRELSITIADVVMNHKVIADEIFGDMERLLSEDNTSVWNTLPPYSEDVLAAKLVVDRMITLGHADAISWEHYGNGLYTDAEAICKVALLVAQGIWDKEKEVYLTSNEMSNREELVDSIIKLELDMFKQVRTDEPSLCKDQPETFKTMRKMTHSVLSTKTLKSYLGDLQKAKSEGRNLLMEKYARMDNRIPPFKTNQIINDIVNIEARWMMELSQKYTQSFQGESISFESYLASELETYSDETLKLYFSNVSRAKKEGRNLAEERYTKLAQQMGYSSIGEMDRSLSN